MSCDWPLRAVGDLLHKQPVLVDLPPKLLFGLRVQIRQRDGRDIPLWMPPDRDSIDELTPTTCSLAGGRQCR